MKRALLVLMLLGMCLASCGPKATPDPAAPAPSSEWGVTVTTPAGTKQLTMENLRALPQTELEFLSKETGTNNKYRGPKLKDVLAAAGADLAAMQSVEVEAEDSFFSKFSRDLALNDTVVLVIEMDGGPLPEKMGKARVLALGQETKYQVKFVKSIIVK